MTSQSRLVSTVIPTRNRSRLLRRAIESVLSQSYRALEIVVVDDASTDHTKAVVAALHDGRVQYICQPARRGGAAARNAGIGAAHGEFIAFLDDDDEWLPDKLAQQMALMQDTAGRNWPVVYTGEQYVGADGSTVRVLRPTRQGDILCDLLFGNYIGSTSTVLAARSALLAVGGFDEALRSCQDWDLWIRLAGKRPFSVVPAPLVRRHVYGDRIDTDLAAQAQGRLSLLEKIRPQLSSVNWRQRRRILGNHYLMLAGQHLACGARRDAARWAVRSCSQDPLVARTWYLLGKVLVRP